MPLLERAILVTGDGSTSRALQGAREAAGKPTVVQAPAENRRELVREAILTGRERARGV